MKTPIKTPVKKFGILPQNPKVVRPDPRKSGYPPEVIHEIRSTRRRIGRWLVGWGAASLALCYAYFHEWPTPVPALAPFVTLVFVVSLLGGIPSICEAGVVSILPYYKKGGPEMPLVEGDTFLHGKALVRNCAYLDSLAERHGLEPLSNFGFYNDLGGKSPVWYDAERGLKTVSGLLRLLEQQPALWYPEEYFEEYFEEYLKEYPQASPDMVALARDLDPLLDDLGRLEASLAHAHEISVPFCLLLRYGNSASGQEMDVRAGYFDYKHSEG